MKLLLTLWIVTMTGLGMMSEGSAGAGAPAELIGFERGENTLLFTVLSQGCTVKDDFQLEVDHSQENVTVVTLIRVKIDGCKRRPFPMELKFSVDDYSATDNRISVANLFRSLAKRRF